MALPARSVAKRRRVAPQIASPNDAVPEPAAVYRQPGAELVVHTESLRVRAMEDASTLTPSGENS